MEKYSATAQAYMSLNLDSVGKNIKERMREHDISDTELARALKVSIQAVWRWKNGVCVPSIDHIANMASLFGVTMEEILGMKPKLYCFCTECTLAPGVTKLTV